ncbi:MAG: S1 RNA-binding domain-containing protein, partial [Acidobacteriota bacterium]
EVVKAGEVVKVRVLEVDLQRRRIALSMKSETPPAPKPRPRREDRPAAGKARQKEDPGGFNRPFTALRDLQKRKN